MRVTFAFTEIKETNINLILYEAVILTIRHLCSNISVNSLS